VVRTVQLEQDRERVKAVGGSERTLREESSERELTAT
jgi:hypothetical protein